MPVIRGIAVTTYRPIKLFYGVFCDKSLGVGVGGDFSSGFIWLAGSEDGLNLSLKAADLSTSSPSPLFLWPGSLLPSHRAAPSFNIQQAAARARNAVQQSTSNSKPHETITELLDVSPNDWQSETSDWNGLNVITLVGIRGNLVTLTALLCHWHWHITKCKRGAQRYRWGPSSQSVRGASRPRSWR